MPIVSVVVIGYNDATNLETAIRSAASQTLRDIEIVVVDDASTDATPHVCARLAAADARVRVFRLEVNSGGCSRPRNVGMQHATGRYVTFLDSDDVLPKRACERLLSAAMRADADMACGRLVRRHHHPRRHIAAHDELYLRPATLQSILDRPDQLRDTPCVGKLYRRSFLLDNDLRFPEGLLFEDLLFTTQAYCTAKRIAIVPELVYVWNVRREADTPSITNRLELRNWRDRFEVHRRIDAFLADHGAGAQLRAAKDRKFLDVDFSWFLRQLREFPADEREKLLDIAARYIRTVDLARQRDAAAASRVGAFLAARGDVERTLTAADFAATAEIGSDLVVEHGRLFWTDAGLDDDSGRTALDVTSIGLLEAGFDRTPFLTVVRKASYDGDRLRLAGTVHDVLDRLGDVSTLAADVEVSGRVGGAFWRVPVRLHHDAVGAGWDAEVDLRAVGRRMLRPTVGHELRLHLRLHRGGETARLALTARDAMLPAGETGLPSPWRRLLGDRARLVERNGRLVLALTDLPGYVDGALDLASRARYAGRRMWLRTR